jgi:hypothetical protein
MMTKPKSVPASKANIVEVAEEVIDPADLEVVWDARWEVGSRPTARRGPVVLFDREALRDTEVPHRREEPEEPSFHEVPDVDDEAPTLEIPRDVVLPLLRRTSPAP